MPSKDPEVHTMSPVIPTVRAVARAVVVSALPVRSPVTLPTTLPVTSPVRVPVRLVAVKSPEPKLISLLKSTTNALEAVAVPAVTPSSAANTLSDPIEATPAEEIVMSPDIAVDSQESPSANIKCPAVAVSVPTLSNSAKELEPKYFAAIFL